MAATNRDLERAVERGDFRSDLYYRLSVVQVELPPLRRRREDLSLLAEYLLARAAAESGMTTPRLAPEALDHLAAHDWPGNVRELDNTIRRAVALTDEDVLAADDLRFVRMGRAQAAGEFDSSLPFREFKEQVLEHHEKAYIGELIEACGGNVSEAARRSGLSRQHLFTLLKKYGLRED